MASPLAYDVPKITRARVAMPVTELQHPEPKYPALPRNVMLCVLTTALAGLIVLVSSLANWESPDLLKYGAFLTVAIFSSGAVIDVPSVTGSFSLTFLFVLFGTLELTKPETVLMSALDGAGALLEPIASGARWRLRSSQAGSGALAAAVAQRGVYRAPWLAAHNTDPSVCLAIAALALFLLNSVPSSLIRALERNSTFVDEWRTGYMWLLPYYAGGAAAAQLASVANRYVGWQTVLLTGPVMYLDLYRLLPDLLATSGRREKARRGDVLSAFADHRGPGARDRGQGSHHPRPHPASPGLRHGTG